VNSNIKSGTNAGNKREIVNECEPNMKINKS
jgi:hypothetical protein